MRQSRFAAVVIAWTMVAGGCAGADGGASASGDASAVDAELGSDADVGADAEITPADAAFDAPPAGETACGNGSDDDLDGHADCLDFDCDGRSGCEYASESSCGDGFDNDADGMADCHDPGCDGHDGCELGGEVTCNDGIDNDVDGMTDCAEAECALACSVVGCAPGEVALGGVAHDLPRHLPDQGSTTSQILLAHPGTVSRVAVRLAVEHGYDADVDLQLVSPAGTTVILSDDNGEGGNDYLDTIFLDGASTAITAAAPPFTGTYRPEGNLASTAGEPVAGAWSLVAVDDGHADDGTVTRFDLAICLAARTRR